MPFFECSRCNDLTYSSARASSLACTSCGAARRRVVEGAGSFPHAREAERRVGPGDHVCATFAEPADAARITAAVLRAGHEDGALLIAFVPPDVRRAIEVELHHSPVEDEVIWRRPEDAYGSAFDPDAFVERYRRIALEEPRPVYVVGCAHEPVQDMATHEEWARYERLATEAAVSCGMVVLCLYDERLHAPEFLLHEHAHPLHARDGVIRRNDAYSYEPA